MILKDYNHPTAMLDLLYQHINQTTGLVLNQHEKPILAAQCRIKQIKRKEMVLQAGAVNRYVTFIIAGAMRMFSIDERGRNHTILLATENCWIYDQESVKQQTASKYCIEAVENCTVLQVPAAELMWLKLQIPAFGKTLALNNLNNLIEIRKRVHIVISMLADERYEHFLISFPTYAERFTQNVISSYLGITCETLSRLKRQRKLAA